jgi:transcriptional regulator with XRE-family HTH domain
MTSQSRISPLQPKDRANYGYARARDIAFDAVLALWRRRSAAGMKQIDVANAIGRDPAWVSRNLRGPGNWTLRTLGELAEALSGELEISVHALEDPMSNTPNYHAYAGYSSVPLAAPTAITGASSGSSSVGIAHPFSKALQTASASASPVPAAV